MSREKVTRPFGAAVAVRGGAYDRAPVSDGVADGSRTSKRVRGTVTSRAIAVVNQKGGSGKTTTVVNLAAALAERDRSVLVVDLDPQASASSWLGVEDGSPRLLKVLTGKEKLENLIRKTRIRGIDAVASSMWLAGAETALGAGPDGVQLLGRALASLVEKRWDYVLLDCPPTLGFLTANALVGASEVCIPVAAHALTLRGLAQLLQTVESIDPVRRKPIEALRIVACRVDRRTRHSMEVVEQMRSRFGRRVCETVIRESVRLAECPSFARPITEYASGSSGAQDYRKLASEVDQQERKR